MAALRFMLLQDPPSSSGGGTSSCFLGSGLVVMADGTRKPIADVQIGDRVRGRWQDNEVIGFDRPMLGGRTMLNLNGKCYNTSDHLTWTKSGWEVVKMEAYLANDYRQMTVVETNAGFEERLYMGIDPQNVAELEIGRTHLASITDDNVTGFEELTALNETIFPEDEQLYALVLGGDMTMYVDGFCFSGWPDDTSFDYQSKIGT